MVAWEHARLVSGHTGIGTWLPRQVLSCTIPTHTFQALHIQCTDIVWVTIDPIISNKRHRETSCSDRARQHVLRTYMLSHLTPASKATAPVLTPPVPERAGRRVLVANHASLITRHTFFTLNAHSHSSLGAAVCGEAHMPAQHASCTRLYLTPGTVLTVRLKPGPGSNRAPDFLSSCHSAFLFS